MRSVVILNVGMLGAVVPSRIPRGYSLRVIEHMDLKLTKIHGSYILWLTKLGCLTLKNIFFLV